MDSQTVEILGRNHLISQLVRAGLEVARPERDRGIDLIAYADLESSGQPFTAIPIQLKAASQRSFSIHRKYEKFPGLVLAYVWNLQSEEATEVFALTFDEALAVAQEMGWTDTESWISKGHYTTHKPSKALLALLEAYRADQDTWAARCRRVVL